MKKFLLFWLLATACIGISAQVRISDEDKARAAELVSQMTLEEKAAFIGAEKSFYTRAIPRLGIPQIRMADGPQGIRNNTLSTLYPCGILTASTWNRDLVRRLGSSLAQDAKARGVSILLGPGVNIYRSPLCGRNFEYFGEDPYLAGETAVQYILGVQEEGVMATVKHFAANNQERSRHRMSSDVDERTLQEIYFPAFRKAVQEAGVGAVMDSYNLVNSVHSTENRWMNVDVLRGQWGFDGIVMSDWTSVYSTLGSANGGLDLECPIGRFFTPANLVPLVEQGVLDEEVLDEKCRHILQTFIAFGFLDKELKDSSIPEDNPESRQTALDLAREGVVLLKNDGVLPLSRKARVLVLGPNAGKTASGGGSGSVTPFSTVTVVQGLKDIGADVRYIPDDELYKSILPAVSSGGEEGFLASYYLGEKFDGGLVHTTIERDPTHSWKFGSPMKELPADGFSVRWEGVYKASASGLVRFVLSGDDGYRLFVDGKLLGGDWGNHALSSRTVFLRVEEGREYDLRFEFYEHAGEATVGFEAGMLDDALLAEALASCTDVVFCCGFDSNLEGEGFDRPFSLPEDQLDMVQRTGGKRLTLVVNAGGGVDFAPFQDRAGAILMAWYPGQEGGTALAEILTGKISPSGKLPISIERRAEDNPCFKTYFDPSGRLRTTYAEGIFMGYRGYDRSGTAPLYPFGYGLSYTEFEYSDLSLKALGADSLEVSFKVKNTGKVDAMESAQIYVRDVEASVARPLKELKGFDKHFIRKGESVLYRAVLGRDAFSWYDVKAGCFRVEPGDFEILAGPSSADLPLKATVKFPFVAGMSSEGIFVECESFSRTGGWVNDQQFMDEMGSPYLLAHGLGNPVEDACTEIEIPEQGTWHVWARTYNWTSPWSSKEGPGKFKVGLGGKLLANTLGCTGSRWEWQYAGKIKLKAGRTTLQLHDLSGFDGRCDAVWLSTSNTAPAEPTAAMRNRLLGLPDNPPVANYDFVVTGGGISGMCAAVAAARQGLKVALVNDRPVLGGNNSAEVRVHLGGTIEVEPYPALGRMQREFGHSKKGNAQPAANYEDDKKQAWIDAEENIDLYSSCRAIAVNKTEENIIASVLVKNVLNSQETLLEAPLFADCTGDGTVGFLAGADYRYGREAASEFGESLAPEEADNYVLGASVQWYSRADGKPSRFPVFEYGLNFNDSSVEKVTMGEWTWETGMLHDMTSEFEYIRDYGLAVIYSNWSWLKNRMGLYADRSLDWVAYVSGKRESRRLMGDYILKQDDIEKAVHHEDATFATTWSIDLHSPDLANTANFPGEEFKTKTVHNRIYPAAVPYRCLYSRNIDNLFMAGRDISVSHVALGTTRVMRTCGMAGEVVGLAASVCHAHDALPRAVYRNYLSELQELMRKGAAKPGPLPDNQKFNEQKSLPAPRLLNPELQ